MDRGDAKSFRVRVLEIVKTSQRIVSKTRGSGGPTTPNRESRVEVGEVKKEGGTGGTHQTQCATSARTCWLLFFPDELL